MGRRLALLIGAVALIVLGVVLVTTRGGDGAYHARVLLDNAGGLRSGSPVVVGGVPVGKVKLSIDKKTGKVLADMTIDDKYAPLGKGTKGEIIAQNLLGQKQLSIKPAKNSEPAPSGYTIPQDKVVAQTDLDQVLNVLDQPTRTRLAIFVNEAGTAFTGRKQDFNRLLRDVDGTFGDTATLLKQLNTDNASLRRAVSQTDRYVDTTTKNRTKLVNLIDKVGQTSETVAARRAGLRSTLANAPRGLGTLRSFLARLQDATVPLGPAATKLSQSAKPLRQVQDALPGFTEPAVPTLKTASGLAPDLNRLALRATPTLRQAVPTVRRLRKTATEDLPAVSDTLQGSVANTLAVIENWSRAIQYRDGLSHIFRGEASFALNPVQSSIQRITKTGQSTTSAKSRESKAKAADQKQASSTDSGNVLDYLLKP